MTSEDIKHQLIIKLTQHTLPWLLVSGCGHAATPFCAHAGDRVTDVHRRYMTTLLAVAVNCNIGELEEAGWGVVEGWGWVGG